MAAWINLGDILRLPAFGDRVAYVDLCDSARPRSFTANELSEMIAAVARGLRRRGIGVGDRVGILAANRVEFVASYLGIMRMGAVAVPINHKLPVPIIGHICRDSAISLQMVDTSRAPLVPAGLPIVSFDGDSEDGFEALLDRGPAPVFVPGPHDLAEILYTSGSTGVPKGVPLTHRGQLWALGNFLKDLASPEPRDVTLVVAPLYHMNGLYFTAIALANRMTVVSMPRFDARRYLETVARYRCTVLSGIPTMFALMVRERDLVERVDLTCVREVSIGSAPLTGALLAQVRALFPRATVSNGFGTTEAGPVVFGPHPDGLCTPPLSLGYPMREVDWKLVDGPSVNEGLLVLRTPALMEGYLNLPQVTEEKMRGGWYHTGDIMRRDSQGFFYFVGRADDMFVCGGENIYPVEVESVLERHPKVAQAIVVPAPDDIKGHIPVAFIVPRQGTQPSPEEIKQYALDHGPAYAHPRFVLFREVLPLSGTHKIDRTTLAAEARRVSRAAGRAE